MRIHLASDHAGFELKEYLHTVLVAEGHTVIDHGAAHMIPEDDYPDTVLPCAQAVAADEDAMGIIVGGSGQGEAMVANRVGGIRAAVYYGVASDEQVDAGGVSLDMIASVRAHNNANMLAIGARFVAPTQAEKIVRQFIETPFSKEERHMRRIAKF